MHIYCIYIYIISSIYLPCPINIFCNDYLNVSDKLEQLLEVGDTESSCRIPALGSVPECSGNNTRLETELALISSKRFNAKRYTYTRERASGLSVVAVAADRLATSNVGKALVGISVNQRVQKSESRLALTETGIVQESNHTSDNR